MSFHVLSASSYLYRDLSELSDASKHAYAKQHGYSWSRCTHVDYTHQARERIEFCYKCMRRGTFEWLFFVGSDAVITNPNVKLESFVSPDVDFIFAEDSCGPQPEAWLLRNCPASLDYLLSVMESTAPSEQDALKIALRDSPLRVKIVPQKDLNAYAHFWLAGDFVCNIAGRSIEQRLAFFKTQA